MTTLIAVIIHDTFLMMHLKHNTFFIYKEVGKKTNVTSF